VTDHREAFVLERLYLLDGITRRFRGVDAEMFFREIRIAGRQLCTGVGSCEDCYGKAELPLESVAGFVDDT